MRFLTRALIVVAVGVLVMAAGRSPGGLTGDRDARAASVVGAQQPADAEQGERDSADQPATGADADRAKRAAEAAVPGATAREVEHSDDDDPGSAWEVELSRPGGATVEVDLDAGFKVLATDRDDDRRGDD
jgi:Peptidase propeptide and YPEB domain